ncbi:hypothetical protein ISN45_At02g010170 [Arabidopsis thaliana x Arabidopsis arenosa]|uniref:Uncharacterized protein n=2 Tax=Arabidopsis TaxID=3701 RepID=A0A8T2FYE4_ARASU|nr:hypothetical protein ISN45_At02g010170 [Arabidopsis thaliana x Arabidopsis arenosa]KAG7640997.1 hypothetical protein ISN44_As02g010660 [Arabidopsis suecica]
MTFVEVSFGKQSTHNNTPALSAVISCSYHLVCGGGWERQPVQRTLPVPKR